MGHDKRGGCTFPRATRLGGGTIQLRLKLLKTFPEGSTSTTRSHHGMLQQGSGA